MDSRPAIGVATQTLQAIDGIPEALPHSWVMNHRYFVALASVGAAPLMVPLFDADLETLRSIYDRLDGVFLAGGVDIDPTSYGDDRHESCGRTDPPRDRVEIELARWAAADGKPVLGVCRGMQIINIAAGGSLVQDCGEEVPGAIKHDYFPTGGHARDYIAHEVRLREGSRIRAIYGADAIGVNSMHHQGICRLADGLVPTAHASDGLVEAVEAEGDSFVIGVQWHPEMLIDRDAGTRRLFTAFIDAAREWRESREVVGV